jgi:hypothetical protein
MNTTRPLTDNDLDWCRVGGYYLAANDLIRVPLDRLSGTYRWATVLHVTGDTVVCTDGTHHPAHRTYTTLLDY